VSSEIGVWMQHRPSKSGEIPKAGHPSGLQKAGMPKKKEGEQNET